MTTAKSFVSRAIKEGLYTSVVGRRILSYPSLPSTMDQAAWEAQKGTLEGTVLLAMEQTAGRGRFQRQWVSHSGNLLLSIVFYPSLKSLPYLSIVASLAVVRTIMVETGLKPTLKWPNDVLLRGKKVCGLLVEDVLKGDKIAYAIVGVGLNVALDSAKIPELATDATSLNLEVGKAVDRGPLLRRLLLELDDLYLALGRDESPVEEWRGYLETLGKDVEVRWGGEVIAGYAQAVDELGHLVLRCHDGKLLTLAGGEVSVQTAPP